MRMPRDYTRRMTSSLPTSYTTRRCICTDTTLLRLGACGYPFCSSRRCGRCHVCRFVGADTIPVLSMDERRFLTAWHERPNQMPQGRLSAAETRLVFKLAEMGLGDQ